MRLALLLAAFAVLAGCATIKGWFTPAPAPAEVQEPEEAARRSAQPPPSPAPPPPPAAPRTAAPAPAPRPPAPAAPPTPAPPPPAPPPPPVLSPDLSAADEQKLRAQTLERIDGTEERLRKIDAAKLASAQQDNLRTVQSFLDKAREALRVQEFQRAFTLADKAYLLADELLRSSR